MQSQKERGDAYQGEGAYEEEYGFYFFFYATWFQYDNFKGSQLVKIITFNALTVNQKTSAEIQMMMSMGPTAFIISSVIPSPAFPCAQVKCCDIPNFLQYSKLKSLRPRQQVFVQVLVLVQVSPF